MPFEQAPIHRFLGQRVAKDVGGPLGLDALVNEFEAAQLAQRADERGMLGAHRAQQAEGNFPADHRGCLKNLFCFLRQSIGSGHHDVVDRVRDH